MVLDELAEEGAGLRWWQIHERVNDVFDVDLSGPAIKCCLTLLRRWDLVKNHVGLWSLTPKGAARLKWLKENLEF